MMTGRGYWAAGSWVVVVLLVACSDDGGSSSGAGGSNAGGSGQSAGGSSQNAGGSGQNTSGSGQNAGSGQNTSGSGQGQSCDSCQASRCQSEGSACDADQKCASAYAELKTCRQQNPNDPALCWQVFEQTSGPVGLALTTCTSKAQDEMSNGIGPCAKACLCVIGPGCGDCVWGSCCDQLVACIQDAGCKQTYYGTALPCILTAADPSAQAQCIADLKANGGLAASFGSCIEGSLGGTCASACQLAIWHILPFLTGPKGI